MLRMRSNSMTNMPELITFLNNNYLSNLDFKFKSHQTYKLKITINNLINDLFKNQNKIKNFKNKVITLI